VVSQPATPRNIDDCARSLDSGTRADIAIFDFSKAFDSVPHKRLLVKLHSFGIRGGTLRWVSCRLQRVTLSGTQSSWRAVTSAVPQGTVLGPLLFLLYINDTASDIRSEIRLFADDCKLILYRAIKSHCDCLILQDDIAKLHQWSLVWQMTFNAKNVVLFHMHVTHSSLTTHLVKSNCLWLTLFYPYRGVTISSDLRWHKHMSIHFSS